MLAFYRSSLFSFLIFVFFFLTTECFDKTKESKPEPNTANQTVDEEKLEEILTKVEIIDGKPYQMLTKEQIKEMKMQLKEIRRIRAQQLGKRVPIDEPSLLIDDILLAPEDIRRMLDNLKNNKSTEEVSILANRDVLWPNATVHYTYDSSVSLSLRTKIREAIAYYESHTCLDFRYYNPANDSLPTHWIKFSSESSGCWSYVGYVSSLGLYQVVALSSGCAVSGIIQHEIGHALGLYHEQSRRDRDSYVNILFHNIESGREHNFEKCSQSGYFACQYPHELNYDFGSVMQYRGTAFSNYGEITIESRDPDYQITMGQRGHLSFLDTKQINIVYCSVAPSRYPQIKANPCASSRTVCRNGGYLNPSHHPRTTCDKCICPDQWKGSTCETRGGESHCGGSLTASSSWRNLTGPTNMEKTDRCVWFITSASGSRIQYKLNKNELRMWAPCSRQYIEFKDRDFSNTGHSARQLRGWTTASNRLVVIAQSSNSNGNRFSISYRLQGERDECGTRTYDPTVHICCSNRLWRKGSNTRCCGIFPYNPSSKMCCSGKLSIKGSNTYCCGRYAYNPSRSVCCGSRVLSRSSTTRKCCFDITYDPRLYFCCSYYYVTRKSSSKACCGERSIFDPRTSYCCNGQISTKIDWSKKSRDCCNGTTIYNTAIQLCCNGNLQTKTATKDCCAGTTYYNPKSQMCCKGKLTNKNPIRECCAGQRTYDPRFFMCCNGAVSKKSLTKDCCGGTTIYNPKSQMCCNNLISPKTPNKECCTGTTIYNPNMQMCCKGELSPKNITVDCCGQTTIYNPLEKLCCNKRLSTKAVSRACCAGRTYNPGYYTCCRGKISKRSFSKECCAGTTSYNPTTHICCADQISRKNLTNDCCGDSLQYNPMVHECRHSLGLI